MSAFKNRTGKLSLEVRKNQTRNKTVDNHHNDDDSLIPLKGKRHTCKQSVCKFTSTNTDICITIQITNIPLH